MLAPVYHITKKAEDIIIVTLNSNGEFMGAEEYAGSSPSIIIPCTEESLTRTGKKVAPYPLCEAAKHLHCKNTNGNNDFYEAYIGQLSAWRDYELKASGEASKAYILLNAVYRYVTKSDFNIEEDIKSKTNGLPKVSDKTICWQVQQIVEPKLIECWKCEELF